MILVLLYMYIYIPNTNSIFIFYVLLELIIIYINILLNSFKINLNTALVSKLNYILLNFIATLILLPVIIYSLYSDLTGPALLFIYLVFAIALGLILFFIFL